MLYLNQQISNIVVLQGTATFVKDVKVIYHQEFDEVLRDYNDNQTGAERRIPDCCEHVAKKEQDMAVGTIDQIGDREYWQRMQLSIWMKIVRVCIWKEYVGEVSGGYWAGGDGINIKGLCAIDWHIGLF